jgi:hypothetical protein
LAVRAGVDRRLRQQPQRHAHDQTAESFLEVNIVTLTLARALLIYLSHQLTPAVHYFLFCIELVPFGLRIALWASPLRLRPKPHLSRRQLLVVRAGRAGRAAVETLKPYAWANVTQVGNRGNGENGRDFTMLKFWSMVVDADPGLREARVARLIRVNVRLDQF